MSSTFEILQRRFGDARPGLQLIGVETAAVPVTVLRADVLAQEKRELPVTEEFVIRYVQAGVEAPESIAEYLGLDLSHVLDAAAAQIAEGHLSRRADRQRLALTTLGLEVARDVAATRPVLRQLQLCFDRLAWSLADYRPRELVSKKEAQEHGMLVLPSEQSARIGLDDVTPSSLNALLANEKLQVLRVHKVVASKHLYLPVQLLVYADVARREVELAVCIDDELAVAHGTALDKVGAVERLSISLGDPERRPLLDDELENLRDIDGLSELPNASEVGVASVGTALVRSVGVFDHSILLAEALELATRRLLIISPWIKNAVVTTDFLSLLERRLRVGVTVTIAHGYGDDDSGSDSHALSRLANLASRFKERFTLARVKNTHAKVLIFDDNWISTSFNWLSFRGDPERTYRMEEGTLVRIPERVEKEYQRYVKLIAEQLATD